MKNKIIVWLFLTALFIITINTCNADEPWFYVKYRTLYNGGLTGNGFLIDTRTYSVKADLNPSIPCTFAVEYLINGADGWEGDTDYYKIVSKPVPPPGETTIYNNIYFWANPGTPIGDIRLELLGNGFTAGLTYKLFLVSIPNEISYSGPIEWVISSDNPTHDDIVLPYYSTSDPSTGYKFRAEVTAIPEPSSLLALASCLLPVGVAVMRRRRK